MKTIVIGSCALLVLGGAEAAGAAGNTTKGTVAGAVGGAVVAGPVGAVVGGVGGAVVGHRIGKHRRFHRFPRHGSTTTTGHPATSAR